MTSQPDPLQHLCTIDRDLLFFSADEQQHQLGFLTPKEHRQLQSMIKKTHQRIQKITNLRRITSGHSSTTSTLSETDPSLQHAAIHDFYRQKQVKQLYNRLLVIRERYSVAMQEQQIRQLENDMERYQQLQAIHGLSGRLDVSSQLYDELQHLRHSLTSLRREWKLDRIQDIVTTLATSSPSSPISSLFLVPPSSSSTSSLSEQHGHRWYPSLETKSHTKYSGNIIGVMKNWFGQSRNAASTTPPPKKKQRHHHFGQRPQLHQHLIYGSTQEECRDKIQQLIQDFYRVFEENARQNEQRMHQLYARVFQQDVDPMLAEDMQRLCLAVSAAPPPSLASLLQPGLSSAFGTFCVTSHSMRDSFLITEHDDALGDMLFSMVTPPTSPPSSVSSRKKKYRWEGRITISTKQRQHKQKQKQPSLSNLLVQQPLENTMQQGWSICLGLISEHLLHVGQQYYTKWIHEIIQAQHQQTLPFQLATETLASMYRALQIEQGYAILTRLCTHLESCL